MLGIVSASRPWLSCSQIYALLVRRCTRGRQGYAAVGAACTVLTVLQSLSPAAQHLLCGDTRTGFLAACRCACMEPLQHSTIGAALCVLSMCQKPHPSKSQRGAGCRIGLLPVHHSSSGWLPGSARHHWRNMHLGQVQIYLSGVLTVLTKAHLVLSLGANCHTNINVWKCVCDTSSVGSSQLCQDHEAR